MSGDGPTTVRMGFGAREHFRRKIPYRAPSSASAINLETLLRQNGNLALRVEVESRKAAGERADTILLDLRERGEQGRFYVAFSRQPQLPEAASAEDYEGLLATCEVDQYDKSEAKLLDRIDFELRMGSFKAAELCRLDDDEGWIIVQAFPRDLD